MAIRFLSDLEPTCTAATAAVFVGDPKVDDGMVVDFSLPQGGTARLVNTWAAGDAEVDAVLLGAESAQPDEAESQSMPFGNDATLRVVGTEGTLELAGFPPSAMRLRIGDGEAVDVPIAGAPFPESRTTMYWQLTAFVQEVARQEASGSCGKPWAYTVKSSPADAVMQMAALDAVYTAAGLGARPTTHPAPARL